MYAREGIPAFTLGVSTRYAYGATFLSTERFTFAPHPHQPSKSATDILLY